MTDFEIRIRGGQSNMDEHGNVRRLVDGVITEEVTPESVAHAMYLRGFLADNG